MGTIWAASEIVLGSFLHNLKIPFSGNILTGIGIIILISISYIWTEKGLIWRAGLICAIMKTMSPSAVIFGPMIAIFSEAVLLELSLRLFGKTWFGFIIGAMLAMSWNLAQKIINLIIFYGSNIVEIYTSLLKLAQKQINIQFDIVWFPIIVLLVAYAILGIISAIIGIRVGRKILKEPKAYQPQNFSSNVSQHQQKSKIDFNYSITWLFVNIGLIIIALVLLNFTSVLVWSLSIIGIVGLWAFRYKRALRKLSKPKFWIFFVLLTMITAFVFAKIQSNTLEYGLMIGIQMNFRAVIIIVGFSILGTELYNPKIQQFFLKTYFKQLPLALELSFESLPSMIANIPDFKTIVKNPVSIIHQVISQAEFRLDEIKMKNASNQKAIIITGGIGQGKTSFLTQIISDLNQRKIKVGGILCPAIHENSIRIGYNLVDLKTNENIVLSRTSGDESMINVGKYYFRNEGLEFGKKILATENISDSEVIVIDEIGFFELNNQGWASSLTDILLNTNKPIIIIVRENLIEKVITHWSMVSPLIIDINKYDLHTAVSEILKFINFTKKL
ncbi:MAG TPA: hypothetical protein DDX39_05575 [Bacteroidales bacterium]|nr:MAG: hypothetical protein A2W98_06845 [Bacteroidetes bacterium GWF2_33_38]OFY74573.1 MAG: hypothetical protein A2265_05255 [Bacteroidetes bacterium RIFOXYA12_FULL_33_9]OFY89366.1 MAG: hypothetical protein A2236_05395 [Bacteroidetes bacterium RIFOXYA2_FULL_33_7]HBF88093.1 hypothetical protein [Bacteroidales bacterium]